MSHNHACDVSKQSSLTVKMKCFVDLDLHRHITQIAWTNPCEFGSWALIHSDMCEKSTMVLVHPLSTTNDVCLLILTLPTQKYQEDLSDAQHHNTQLRHDASLVEHVGAHAPGATLASAWLAKDPRHGTEDVRAGCFQKCRCLPNEWFSFTYGASLHFRKLP